MKTKALYNNGFLKISFYGELDNHAAKTAVCAIDENVDEHLPKTLLLDFGGLTFMDSSGIAVVLKAYRRMNELGGGVCVENVPKQAQKILDMANMGRLVKITASAKEA